MEKPRHISLRDLTDRAAVLSAVKECDEIGREAFLKKYQLGEATSYFLEHGGKRNDSKAIVGAAYGYQHGTPLVPHQFSGGESTVIRKLRSLGFTVTKTGGNVREDWSEAEVANTVADYFDMLRLDLGGYSYNKSGHRARLIVKLNSRSDAAIELKHQNISAVLDEIGLPYIPGYKPRKNYQGVLATAVEDYLNQHPDFLNAFASVPPLARSSPDRQPLMVASVLVDPPTLRPKLNPKGPPTFRPRHVDFVQTDVKNRNLGSAGEQFVIRFEKQRLADAGRSDLAAKVEWVSKTQGDGAGYDVASFHTSGEARYIEVKTTNCGKQFPFILTDREVEFSALNAANYCLYRVFDFSRSPKLFVISGALRQSLNLRPRTFEASF